jgi:hypothetical protein
VSQVATLLGAKQVTHTLASEQVVPVRLENGRVHHENFALRIGSTTVRTTGSVGLDGTLALLLDVPVPARVLDRLLPNNPRLREALGRQTVKLPVGGTLERPALDQGAFEAAADALVRAAARTAAEDLLKKGEERLFDAMRKKLAPPEKK